MSEAQGELTASRAFSQYDQLLHTLYDSVNSSDGFNAFLSAFAETFDCFTATIAIRDVRTGRLLGGWFYNMPDDAAQWYMTHLAHKDPLLEAAQQCETPRFIATNLDFSRSVSNPLNDPDIEQWRQQFECYDGASALVHRDANRSAFLTLSRDRARRQFSAQDMTLFGYFLPHLRRALKIHDALVQAQSQNESVVSAFEQLPMPLIVCDTRFRVVGCNRAAQAWMQENPWFFIDEDCVRFEDPSSFSHFTLRLVNTVRASVELSAPSAETLALPPEVAGNRKGVTFTFSALTGHESSMGVDLVNGGALLSIHPWRESEVVDRAWLSTSFNFSPAEAEVCQMLCLGQSVDDIAQVLNRGVSTIRSHLKSLYRKTGTARQAELVALVLNSWAQSFSAV
ncbi:regulatory protein, LuxR, putative [gamma proteobacterium HTCC5015]|nr:regulatory protein, LuxR, putative [gamma proteobacterium HTCC5015]